MKSLSTGREKNGIRLKSQLSCFIGFYILKKSPSFLNIIKTAVTGISIWVDF